MNLKLGTTYAHFTLFRARFERFGSVRGAFSDPVISKKTRIVATNDKRRWIGLTKIYNV